MLAAFDRFCITPPLGGTWPEAFIDLRAGVLDDVHARLLWVDDGAGRGGGALLVSLDVLMVGLPELQRLETALVQATGLAPEAVWIMVSHSHSAPIVGAIDDYTGLGPYWQAVCAQAAVTAGKLRDCLQPVRLERGTGTCDFNVNRRLPGPNGCSMRPNLEAVCDKNVPVLAFRGDDGALVGLCYSYCCHPTILLGPQISGDYPGQTSLALEAEHDGTVALFLPGTFGNVRPHLVDEQGDFRRNCTADDAADCARQLQVAVNQSLATTDHCQVNAVTARRILHDLPLAQLPTTDEIDEILRLQWQDLAQLPAVAIHQQLGLRSWAQAVEAARAQPPTGMAFRFSYLALGPVQLVGMSGEFFLEYGIRAQQIFGADTIALGYTHGCQSYVPTDRALLEGGYEPGAWNRFRQLAPFAQGVEAAVDEALLRLPAAVAQASIR